MIGRQLDRKKSKRKHRRRKGRLEEGKEERRGRQEGRNRFDQELSHPGILYKKTSIHKIV